MPGDMRGWHLARARVAEIGRASVRAGVVGPKASQQHADSGLTNGEIATLHEFGNPSTGLPERSFVRKTLRDPGRIAEFEALERKLLGAVIEGRMSRDRALDLLGTWATGAMRATITDGLVRPALAPSTVEAKGSAKVLIESGQLVGAIGWELVK